ncbi:hypothetical protein BN946_scf184694.g2 [Trametes cinnabarina]|uniref:Uncharacterized protein n=1 Tax=Pycnoporus cinnabarinus TaxID=5643 RepID=A0A060SUG2_PYCCI|nr:hypothetical protein BN946_scf184694.g2 [Trametes cinnabarina]
MASVFASVRLSSRPSLAAVHIPRSCRSSLRVRSLHASPVGAFCVQPISAKQLAVLTHLFLTALKKKQKSAAEADDLFEPDDADSLFSDELFGLDVQQKPGDVKPSSVDPAKLTGIPPHNPNVPAPRDFDRNARFDEMYQFMKSCIADKTEHVRQVRSATWLHLFSLATTPEQLEQVAELFPKWRDAKRTFRPATAEKFGRRCEELHCPQLAIKVFGDHPKYGLDLTLEAAKPVLHALHLEHPIRDTITFSALFGVYKLPPVSSDLVCSSLLITACYKHPSHASLTIARALIQSLRQLLQRTEPASMALRDEDHGKPADKEKRWLAWTLKKIEQALQREKRDFSWLRKWRIASGYAGYTDLK